jgi:Mg2+ and Co2+ transporter CorA
MREIKDIRDELHTLGNLFEQQRQVIEQLTRLIGEARMAETTDLYSADTAVLPAASLSSAIQRHIKYVKSMEDNANIPYHAVSNTELLLALVFLPRGITTDTLSQLEDLLDLKQKQANVFEARTARVSGNTVTVFTIVAIIFLPASFMAAFLALPITEYPFNNNNKIKLRYAI